MKLFRRLVVLLLIVGALGYGVYYVAMDLISEKASATIDEKLDSEADVTAVKEKVQTIPEAETLLEEGAKADPKTLPFTTKEEAAKVVMKKVGPTELKNMYDDYQDGMTEADIQQVITKLETNLSEDEMLALKALAYDELNP